MTLIQVRLGAAASAESNNPVLSAGEAAYDTTNKRLKVGDGAAAWNALGWATGIPLVPPPSTGWTAFNSGSVTDNKTSRLMTRTNAASDPFRGEVRTLSPASNYTATCYLEASMPPLPYVRTGIVLRNSGSGNFILFGSAYDAGVGSFVLWTSKWVDPATLSATYAETSPWNLIGGIPKWLRIRDDNTNRYFEYSYNAVDWILHGASTLRTDFITPDQIGWAVSANSGYAGTAVARLSQLLVA